jgi:hypothetical protein
MATQFTTVIALGRMPIRMIGLSPPGCVTIWTKGSCLNRMKQISYDGYGPRGR